MNNRFLVRLRVVSLSALFLLSSLALQFGPLLTSQVAAASAYDDVVQTTDTIQLQPLSTPSCDSYATRDWSLNWSQIFESATGTTTIGETGNQWDWNAFQSSNFASYSSSFANKTHWGVSINNNGSYDQISIYWSENNDLVGEFELNGGEPSLQAYSGDMHYIRGFISDYMGPCRLLISSVGTSSPYLIGQNGGGTNIRMFIANLSDINYPSGYEGEDVPETSNPKPSFIPEVGYSVMSDGIVNGLWLGDPVCVFVGLTETTGCVTNYYLKWTIYGPDGTTVLDQQTLLNMNPYKFRLPGYDTYTLTVDTAGPPPPYATLSPDYNFPTSKFPITFDGTFLTGGTIISDCSDDGTTNDCAAANPLEDCANYVGSVSLWSGGPTVPWVTDPAGFLFCNLENFQITARSAIIAAFVPSFSFFSGFQENLNVFLNDKLGFIATSAEFIISLFNGIITGASTPTCTVQPPGTFFGSTLSIDVCTFDEIYHTGFLVMQSLLIAATVIGLFFAGLHKYHEVVDKR